MTGVPYSLIIENATAAVLVIVYLGYEIRFGRLSDLVHKMDAVIDSVVALAREHDNIDEEKVMERLNGESPDDLIIQEQSND